MPLPLHVWSDELGEFGVGPLHFLKKTGRNIAALDLLLEEGETINNVIIACTRATLDGVRETITLPLAGIPQDMGYPEGGTAFEAQRSYICQQVPCGG